MPPGLAGCKYFPMSPRGKKTIHPLGIIIAVVLIVLAFGGSLFFMRSSSDFPTTPSLDVSAYLENANSLRSNVYKLTGEIENSLAWSPTAGRLFSVSTGTDVVPVLITPEFSQFNIQKGQRFIFLLEVDDQGILRTKQLKKA